MVVRRFVSLRINVRMIIYDRQAFRLSAYRCLVQSSKDIVYLFIRRGQEIQFRVSVHFFQYIESLCITGRYIQ